METPLEEEVSAAEFLAGQETPAPESGQEKDALVIRVQSWATPIAGLVMLVIGLLGGYFGRPLLTAQAPTPLPTSVSAAANPTSSVDREALMASVVSQTRHFKGDPNAPVTIIEFSDFQ